MLLNRIVATSFNEIQEEIRERLDDNSEFFASQYTTVKSESPIESNLKDISTIFQLENEKMEGSLEKAKTFSSELERVAGDIINLAKERRELTLNITRKRQLTLISNPLSLNRLYIVFNPPFILSN